MMGEGVGQWDERGVAVTYKDGDLPSLLFYSFPFMVCDFAVPTMIQSKLPNVSISLFMTRYK
jgi:hypothetical protein